MIIVSLKSFYVIYFTIFLIWIFHYKFLSKNSLILNNILINSSTYLFIIGVSIFLFTVLLNTGCLIYPASFTCFQGLEWAIPIEQVNQMKDWYSLWSKAGANPNYRADNPELYLSNFNWMNNWFRSYFFTKVIRFFISGFSNFNYMFISIKK